MTERFEKKKTERKEENAVNQHYCIKPTFPVRYKHVLMGENWGLTGANVY